MPKEINLEGQRHLNDIDDKHGIEKTWGMTDMPDFKGRKALILGGAFFGSVVSLMAECGFERAETVDEADLIVFVGGADINPELYGQKCLPTTSFSPFRDEKEKAVYEEALLLNKPMFGICRGAQFLHAMNGGELWQHVDGHGGRDHIIYDIEEDVTVQANSYHHQMLCLNDKIEVVAVCRDQISKRFISDVLTVQLKDDEVEIEIEAGAYPETKCFFVQGHPEVGNPEYRSWCMAKLYDFMRDIDLWEQEREPGAEPVASDADDSVEANLDKWRKAAML